MVRRVLVILLAFASAACGGSEGRATAPPASPASVAVAATPTATTPVPSGRRVEDLAAQYAYDASAPLAVSERGAMADGALTIRDIEYTGAKSARARAYLITPTVTSSAPAMVFVAGSNQRREDIRAEAIAVARRGVFALILEQSQVAAGRANIWTFTAQDREEAIQSVIDTRRAIDLLVARADVDRTRVGYYGFSYGAWLGVIAASIDARLSLLVLRSGGPQILTEIARASGRTLQPDYATLMATVDQMTYAPMVTASVLVQNGTRDTTYTADQIRAWQDRIGGTKTVRSYDAGHTLDATANADAVSWTAERWRLP